MDKKTESLLMCGLVSFLSFLATGLVNAVVIGTALLIGGVAVFSGDSFGEGDWVALILGLAALLAVSAVIALFLNPIFLKLFSNLILKKSLSYGKSLLVTLAAIGGWIAGATLEVILIAVFIPVPGLFSTLAATAAGGFVLQRMLGLHHQTVDSSSSPALPEFVANPNVSYGAPMTDSMRMPDPFSPNPPASAMAVNDAPEQEGGPVDFAPNKHDASDHGIASGNTILEDSPTGDAEENTSPGESPTK